MKKILEELDFIMCDLKFNDCDTVFDYEALIENKTLELKIIYDKLKAIDKNEK